jgi:hypothetical protein
VYNYSNNKKANMDGSDDDMGDDVMIQDFEIDDLNEYKQFKRNEISPLNLLEDLYVMQIDISYYTQNDPESFSVLRMYGITQEGASVLCHIKKFRPYFYVPCPR